MSRTSNATLGKEMVQRLEESIVRLRADHPEIGEADLHRLITHAKLLAISWGRKEVIEQDWRRAIELELMRRARN